MAEPKIILDSQAIEAFVRDAARAIAGWEAEPGKTALVGIRTQGAPLAERIRAALESGQERQVPSGILDITLYRDDLAEVAASPLVRGTEIDFDVQGMTLVLVDDVIYTGRTVRAAIDQVMDFGRPRAIKLVVLVDRGGRELPIQPDFTGLVAEVRDGEDVVVQLAEPDGLDRVQVVTKR